MCETKEGCHSLFSVCLFGFWFEILFSGQRYRLFMLNVSTGDHLLLLSADPLTDDQKVWSMSRLYVFHDPQKLLQRSPRLPSWRRWGRGARCHSALEPHPVLSTLRASAVRAETRPRCFFRRRSSCRRKSVRLSSASVTLLHPTQMVELFGNILPQLIA